MYGGNLSGRRSPFRPDSLCGVQTYFFLLRSAGEDDSELLNGEHDVDVECGRRSCLLIYKRRDESARQPHSASVPAHDPVTEKETPTLNILRRR